MRHTDGNDDTETPDDPQTRARTRRRRTVLVTGSWVASAAVVAAMTAGIAAPDDSDAGPESDGSSSIVQADGQADA